MGNLCGKLGEPETIYRNEFKLNFNPVVRTWKFTKHKGVRIKYPVMMSSLQVLMKIEVKLITRENIKFGITIPMEGEPKPREFKKKLYYPREFVKLESTAFEKDLTSEIINRNFGGSEDQFLAWCGLANVFPDNLRKRIVADKHNRNAVKRLFSNHKLEDAMCESYEMFLISLSTSKCQHIKYCNLRRMQIGVKCIDENPSDFPKLNFEITYVNFEKIPIGESIGRVQMEI